MSITPGLILIPHTTAVTITVSEISQHRLVRWIQCSAKQLPQEAIKVYYLALILLNSPATTQAVVYCMQTREKTFLQRRAISLLLLKAAECSINFK